MDFDKHSRTKILDVLAELKDAGAVASSGAGEVDSAAAVFEVGPGVTLFDMVIDVSACEVADDDELYEIKLQGSDNEDFSADLADIVAIKLGAAGALVADADVGVGRYVIPATNRLGDKVYDYLRVYHAISGTVATGIDYTAYLSKPSGLG